MKAWGPGFQSSARTPATDPCKLGVSPRSRRCAPRVACTNIHERILWAGSGFRGWSAGFIEGYSGPERVAARREKEVLGKPAGPQGPELLFFT